MGSFIVILDVLVVTTALTAIRNDLHASLTALEWTVNAYSLTFAVLLLTGSAIGDRFGRRRMFTVGLGIFTLMSVACALSTGIGPLVAARAVQGCGAALVMPLALTQISVAFEPQDRGRALGIFSGVTGLAIFLGPVIGGAVTQGLAWQWIFWINVPIGLITIALVLRRMPETHGQPHRLDIVGAALATIGTMGIVWGLVRGNVVGWDTAEVLITLVAGVLGMALFVLWEMRAPEPMLSMRFFRNRTFSTANTANFCLYASVYGILFLLAQYLQNSLGNGALVSGLKLIPWTATLMIFAPIAGAYINRFGERRFMVIGLLGQAIGVGWLALIASPHLAFWQMALPMVVTGVSASLAMPAAQKSVVGAVQPQDIGKASGAVTALRMLGGVFGIAIVTAVFEGTGSFASPQTFSDGFAHALAVAALMALVGAAAGLAMPARRAAVDAPSNSQRSATQSPANS
ncbi:MAG TPA: DHA2 family efflux MFS transporter permease subunit [Pseudonocardiaceae bacterium]|nr:DHA2 family efflux MFS transporter permease subunit [Pseudonocardiaceae bacterium]